MCLLAHLWLGLLQRPICILLFRHPLPVAISLSVRFFPLSLSLSFFLSVCLYYADLFVCYVARCESLGITAVAFRRDTSWRN
jgi:hypothetical protein